MKEPCCESCGSNIMGSTWHLCSIKTATGWRKEIPLHLRRQPLVQGSHPKLVPARDDHRLWSAYEAWLERHKNADALIVDTRTGMVIEAHYDNPYAMHTSEQMDFWFNASRINEALDEEADR